MDKDLYKILGVSEDASQEEIKKVYKRLAKEYHPDKNKGDKHAEERFKEISDAYSILGNAEKRKKYDQLRRMGAHEFSSGNGGSWEEIFQHFGGGARGGGSEFSSFGFDLEDLFGSIFGGRRTSGHASAGGFRGSADLQTEVAIPFLTAVQGGRIDLNIPGDATCPQCGGNGRSDGKTCGKCSGSGRIKKSRTVSVQIPAGIEEGTRLRVSGEGTAGIDGTASGDLLINVRIQPHNLFRRKGLDILVDLPLNLAQAVLGSKVRIPTPHGSKAVLTIPAGTQPDTQFRLKGQGIRAARGTGDLLVTAKIKIPANLTEQQRELLERFAKAADLKY